ncbi:Pyruvate kinase 1, cytosolic [Thalictrum thalictroides]|uniref:Pyruvate kinase n=1 Tax=Thalictrum thalictroides TaxID=46969 RepID=A0A7J6W206_THATH|nr:Pyruvate kinase 1, cytosolic [Thalictrum thalictroides]
MHGGQLLIEEPIRLTSVLTTSKPTFLPSLTKVVGTLGPKSRSVDVLEECLKAGLSVARFDFSWLDESYHQETLENLKKASKNVNKLCAVMLDTQGPELQVHNKTGHPIQLKVDDHVTITPDISIEPSSDILPVYYNGLSEAVNKGDTIFLGQYLFTGSETTSVWLEVVETTGSDVICLVKNSAILAGFIFTMHISQVHINLPTLSEVDKQVISTWGSCNNVDIVSLSYTRHVEDVRELREFLNEQNLHETQIFAKIENVEGLKHFDEILQEVDGIILSRGNLGIDLPPEKVFLFQKYAVYKCNMAGKPAIVTRVVDSMTDNLRPTRAEATDVANAVLDGADGILLGAETLRGLYPVETIKTVGRICAEAESVYNQALHYKRAVKHAIEPMSREEPVAASAVHAASKVKAAIIVVFTSSGRAARWIARYRPMVPVVAVVIPRQGTGLSGTSQARQCLCLRGIYPILDCPNVSTTSDGSTEEADLTFALDHSKAVGLIKPNDRVVVFQKIGDSAVVKIVNVED